MKFLNTNKYNYLQMVSAGIHYGTLINFLDPVNVDAVYGKRFGKAIFNLTDTVLHLKKGSFFLVSIISNRGKFLFLENFASFSYQNHLNLFFLLNQYFLNTRITGGILTNFKYIYFDICQRYVFSNLFFNEEGRLFYNKYLAFRAIRRLPDVLFIASSERVPWAAKETVHLKLPCFYPNDGMYAQFGLSFPFFGNNNLQSSLLFYVDFFVVMILLGYLKEIHTFFNMYRLKYLEKDIDFLKYWFGKNLKKIKKSRKSSIS